MEERITRLEETVTLQDRTIEQLSDALVAQQKEIDELTRQVVLLGKRIKGMIDAADSGPTDDGPPPHYL